MKVGVAELSIVPRPCFKINFHQGRLVSLFAIGLKIFFCQKIKKEFKAQKGTMTCTNKVNAHPYYQKSHFRPSIVHYKRQVGPEFAILEMWGQARVRTS